MKKRNWYAWLLGAGLCMTTPQMQAQLLKGYIRTDSLPDMQIAYTLDGDIMNTVYEDVKVAADGSFDFDRQELPGGTLDISITVDKEIFGAHLEQGKQVVVYLEPDRQGNGFEARFEGDNADISRFYNGYVQAFDIMKYFAPDPADSKPIAEYRRILEEEYGRAKKLLPLVKDKELNSYYALLTEGMYAWSKLRILMDQAYEEQKKFRDYPEYNEIISRIDPNDPISLRTNLAMAWLDAQTTEETDFEADQTKGFLEKMDVIEKQITRPDTRLALTRYIGYAFFSYYAGHSDVPTFWKRYQAFAAAYPQLIELYGLKVKAATSTGQGDPMPYDPLLTRPDGTTCRLSELCGSLPVYIDVWATWCAPCCKEIPHLEKVVAQFEGKGQVRIVSISVDQNRNAWLKKLEKDQPAWEQYILTPEEEKKFMTAWGIGGIPRFILLDKEGRIANADALRPSDEGLVEIINQLSL